MRQSGCVQSVSKAFALLKAFSPQEPRLTASQLAKKVGMPMSTTHRLLKGLSADGMLSRDSHGRYRIGPELYALGTLYLRTADISEASRPILTLLNDLTSESVNVSIPAKGNVVLIMKEESKHAFRVAQQVGSVYPAYASSMGIALLSELSEAEIDNIYPHEDLLPLTERTLTSKTQLKQKLQEVRESGVAYDIEGAYMGVVCVSAVIRDATGHAVAAMSISGPLIRMKDDLQERFAPLVKLGAAAISYRLGYQGRQDSKPTTEAIRSLWHEKAEPTRVPQEIAR